MTSPNVSLVLKDVESDRDRLERRLERLEQGTPDSENKQAHDQIRLRDLEMENARLEQRTETLEREGGAFLLQKQACPAANVALIHICRRSINDI